MDGSPGRRRALAIGLVVGSVLVSCRPSEPPTPADRSSTPGSVNLGPTTPNDRTIASSRNPAATVALAGSQPERIEFPCRLEPTDQAGWATSPFQQPKQPGPIPGSHDTFVLSENRLARPVVGSDTIVVSRPSDAGARNALVRYDRATNEARVASVFDGCTVSTATGSEGVVYVNGSASARQQEFIAAVDLDTGAPVWAITWSSGGHLLTLFDAHDELVTATPVLRNNGAITPFRVWRFDKRTGAARHTDVPELGLSNFYRLFFDGEALWVVQHSPAFDRLSLDGRVLVSSEQSKERFLAATAREVWTEDPDEATIRVRDAATLSEKAVQQAPGMKRAYSASGSLWYETSSADDPVPTGNGPTTVPPNPVPIELHHIDTTTATQSAPVRYQAYLHNKSRDPYPTYQRHELTVDRGGFWYVASPTPPEVGSASQDASHLYWVDAG